MTTMKRPQGIINQLSPQRVLAVLKTLAASVAKLAKYIVEIAIEHLSGVNENYAAEKEDF